MNGVTGVPELLEEFLLFSSVFYKRSRKYKLRIDADDNQSVFQRVAVQS
jgi:hypothetical protein